MYFIDQTEAEKSSLTKVIGFLMADSAPQGEQFFLLNHTVVGIELLLKNCGKIGIM